MLKPKMIYTDESIEMVVRKFIEKYPDSNPDQFIQEFTEYFDDTLVPTQKFISYFQRIKKKMA
jgi:hypothetical protein